jgi:hypothetical protein
VCCVLTSRSLVTASNNADSSASALSLLLSGDYLTTPVTAPTNSSLQRLPYNSLNLPDNPPELQNPSRLWYLGTDRVENTVHCCTPINSRECVCLWRRYLVTAAHSCLLRICPLAADVVSLFVSRSLPSNGSIRYSIFSNPSFIFFPSFRLACIFCHS